MAVGPGLGAWNGPPSPLPPTPVLPGEEVGGNGEDAGQGGDDTAHVGQEGQVVLVHGVHLHGGHLGPRDRSALPRCAPSMSLWSGGGGLKCL